MADNLAGPQDRGDSSSAVLLLLGALALGLVGNGVTTVSTVVTPVEIPVEPVGDANSLREAIIMLADQGDSATIDVIGTRLQELLI